MKWIVEDGMVFPACKRCGEYPLSLMGKDEYGYFIMKCPYCGRVEALKTNPSVLAYKALDRWYRR